MVKNMGMKEELALLKRVCDRKHSEINSQYNDEISKAKRDEQNKIEKNPVLLRAVEELKNAEKKAMKIAGSVLKNKEHVAELNQYKNSTPEVFTTYEWRNSFSDKAENKRDVRYTLLKKTQDEIEMQILTRAAGKINMSEVFAKIEKI
jgi:hypothetical protein